MAISTLGRKAMKKQLKKLRAEANRTLKSYYKATDELQLIREQNKDDRIALSEVYVSSLIAVRSLVDYISTLKDYTLELEETFDTLLEPKKQPKPTQKKEEAKKTKYID